VATSAGIDAAAVTKQAEAADLRLVRFLWCGNDGTVRAKASSVRGLETRIGAGIGVTVAMQAMNGLDALQPVEGMGPVGEIRIVPDPDTFRVLPYAPRTGAMLVDQRTLDGDVAPVDQRGFLRRMVDALAERGAGLEVAFENEFALAVRAERPASSDHGRATPLDARLAGRPAFCAIDESLCFSTIGMTAAQDYVDALVDALEAQRIQLEQYYAELGHGQQEISTAHRPALQAADEQLLVRETIRGVAAAHGLVASLAPKPWPDGAGNGGHVHFSLWDLAEQRNRFHDPAAPDGLSAEGRAFLAGVLEHLPGLCGLTAPSFNSYRRMVPQYWAGVFTCWGHDNREAPLRLPSLFQGMEEASTNVELKAADATCNPYLAIGGLIAAGLDGLARGLEPPDPVEVDPATIDADERDARGIRRLPTTQEEALDALAADSALTGALGPVLTASYLAVRRSEWETYSAEDEAFEQQGHFLKY
jgi:glutamine synthetase